MTDPSARWDGEEKEGGRIRPSPPYRIGRLAELPFFSTFYAEGYEGQEG